MIQKLLDYIYIVIFGKYTLDGFVTKETEIQNHKYIFDSVFPDEETMRIALPPSASISTSK